MAPGNIYLLTFALIVIPLLPFSRMAIVVALAWLPGQFAYLAGGDAVAADLIVAAAACVAGIWTSTCWQQRLVAALYGASFGVLILTIAGGLTAHDGWWLDWSLAMTRVLLLPATLNWKALHDVADAFRERRTIERDVWRRVLCWRST